MSRNTRRTERVIRDFKGADLINKLVALCRELEIDNETKGAIIRSITIKKED